VVSDFGAIVGFCGCPFRLSLEIPSAKLRGMSSPSSLSADRKQVNPAGSPERDRQPGEAGRTILHIGLGAFHRAHQAVYLHRLRQQGDTSWSIVGGNIRSDADATAVALAAQHGEYTLETVSPAGDREYERITSLVEVVPYDPALARLIDVGSQPATRIISFTVTEGGYYLGLKTRLNEAHPDLQADLSGSNCTIYGAISAILRMRKLRGAGPVTLLSCDNLRSNGSVFRAGLLDFLHRRGEAGLARWVEACTSCPSGMVDRITPRPTVELVARVKRATGRDDLAPVMSERFSQWVVEDRFVAGRPAWDAVGVEMVDSVHAHEEAKIRILNASHSCIAWAGTLLGLAFIHQAAAVPEIRQMAWRYVTDDVIPCLDTAAKPSSIALHRYRDVVLERFGSPFLSDTNERVATDSYSKIPAFVVPTLRERIAQDLPVDSTAILPALFFAFLSRWHAGTLPYAYHDSLMDSTAAHAFFSAADPLQAYCRDPALWTDLAGNPMLTGAVRAAHERLQPFLLQTLVPAFSRSA
jgi:D-arabinitol 4-dehydrogenase